MKRNLSFFFKRVDPRFVCSELLSHVIDLFPVVVDSFLEFLDHFFERVDALCQCRDVVVQLHDRSHYRDGRDDESKDRDYYLVVHGFLLSLRVGVKGVPHVGRFDCYAQGAASVPVGIIVMWLFPDPIDGPLPVADRIGHSGHIEIDCFPFEMLALVAGSYEPGVPCFASEATGHRYRTGPEVITNCLDMLQLVFLHICRITGAEPPSAAAPEFFRVEVLGVFHYVINVPQEDIRIRSVDPIDVLFSQEVIFL